LDYDLEKCAQYHVNKHISKMITESTQILSTVCRLSGVNTGYKAAYIHHPCVKWAAESLDNWFWLKLLVLELEQEWILRYKHEIFTQHKAAIVCYNLSMPDIPAKGLTPFALAMPDYCKLDDPVESYRNYYMQEKRHLANWGSRGIPYWYK
jgi:hypothetical protein